MCPPPPPLSYRRQTPLTFTTGLSDWTGRLAARRLGRTLALSAWEVVGRTTGGLWGGQWRTYTKDTFALCTLTLTAARRTAAQTSDRQMLETTTVGRNEARGLPSIPTILALLRCCLFLDYGMNTSTMNSVHNSSYFHIKIPETCHGELAYRQGIFFFIFLHS